MSTNATAGLAADRPDPSDENAGAMWLDETGALTISTGTAWLDVTMGGGGGGGGVGLGSVVYRTDTVASVTTQQTDPLLTGGLVQVPIDNTLGPDLWATIILRRGWMQFVTEPFAGVMTVEPRLSGQPTIDLPWLGSDYYAPIIVQPIEVSPGALEARIVPQVEVWSGLVPAGLNTVAEFDALLGFYHTGPVETFDVYGEGGVTAHLSAVPV